jgi:YegS/Rv2252/BmrU family lipid kinase
MKKVAFIMNPISGTISKAGIPQLIENKLDKNLFDYEIRETERAGHATEIAAELAEKGVDLVMAVGGDGTVNEVGRALINTETAMGIIPCGSGNGLARHLCLPMDMQGALDIINAGQTDRFDYGIINGHPFFCTCGMGFDAFVSLKFAESGKRGLTTYVENVLKEGLNYEADTYTVETDTGIHRHKAFLIACANAAQYGNNAYIAPGASMQDGLMDVSIIEPFPLIESGAIAYQMVHKTIYQNERCHSFKCRSITIQREKPGVIHYDGDPADETSIVRVEIVPHDIMMLVNIRKHGPRPRQIISKELLEKLHRKFK